MHLKQRKRIFVVEIEKRQIIRKTSESRLIICADCLAESDFISLRQAALIFGIDERQIFDFLNKNNSHYKRDEQGEIFICLKSFIEAVNKTNNSKVKLLGANNEKQQ